MVLLIGYDLSAPPAEYTALIEAIKAYGRWWHYLDSTWLIDTDQSARQVIENLRQYIRSPDRLIVIQIKNNWWAIGFPEKAYEWLKNRLSDL